MIDYNKYSAPKQRPVSVTKAVLKAAPKKKKKILNKKNKAFLKLIGLLK